jgi:hypothetical protein
MPRSAGFTWDDNPGTVVPSRLPTLLWALTRGAYTRKTPATRGGIPPNLQHPTADHHVGPLVAAWELHRILVYMLKGAAVHGNR